MDIIWHGNSCFTIKTKSATAIINPYREEKGFKLPALKGALTIITGSSEGNDNLKAVQGETKVIDWPGEYEVSGIVLTAKKSQGEKGFFFTMVGDDTRICYMEDTGKDITDELVESIGDVDILLISVGGTAGAGPEMAHKIVEEIEPRCIIPMNFAVPGSTGELQTADAFLKLAGGTAVTPIPKFSISGRGALKEDQTECVVLEPQLA
ncbi:MBL fold metallo-hydrolase [Patescibacteria group bacterium]|nr:MBL fold metallo-hydrolase [Patescibacteria group bacterium]MBU1703584.1 MBL fold metallo-hydrolase [Patescibacteria group bacterium]MBU1953671.1 MBL fold metallo-hydrolase [Patescibacteria group bacterium]